MRKGGGKAKGSAFERDICKQLSLWVSGGKREDCFWRSAMSGGRATVHLKRGANLAQHAGDITATHSMGERLTKLWFVECKRYRDLSIAPSLMNGKGLLAGFWQVAMTEADKYDKHPMLIVKQDRMATLMLVPTGPAMVSAGFLLSFPPKACLMRSYVMQADVFDFEAVLKRPYKEARRK